METASRKDRGSSDLKRCVEIGRRVLRALEEASSSQPRVEVYGDPGNEKIDLRDEVRKY